MCDEPLGQGFDTRSWAGHLGYLMLTIILIIHLRAELNSQGPITDSTNSKKQQKANVQTKKQEKS
jgi:hypothetical protein